MSKAVKIELIIGFLSILLFAGIIAFDVGRYGEKRSVNISLPSGNTSTSGNQVLSGEQKVALTPEEVAKHRTPADCWLIIEGNIYGVSSYLDAHPGGARAITPYCGQEATQVFATKGGRGVHSQAAYQDLVPLLIGPLNGTISAQTFQAAISTSTQSSSVRTREGGREREYDD